MLWNSAATNCGGLDNYLYMISRISYSPRDTIIIALFYYCSHCAPIKQCEEEEEVSFEMPGIAELPKFATYTKLWQN